MSVIRRRPIERRPIDLGAIVLDMAKLLGHLLGQKVELACRVPGGLGQVVADRNQMEQVILSTSP